METLKRNVLVAAAVFCSIVGFTSAVAVSNINCTSSGTECPANSACDATGTTPFKCKCSAAYKQGASPADNTCVPKGYGDSCTESSHCNTATSHSDCPTGSTTCKCVTDYTAINNQCQRGLGNPCTDDTSCSAVDNAECPATKKCTCKANFKEANGQCSTANGLQTLLSAPVALLLSFLTIFTTILQ